MLRAPEGPPSSGGAPHPLPPLPEVVLRILDGLSDPRRGSRAESLPGFQVVREDPAGFRPAHARVTLAPGARSAMQPQHSPRVLREPPPSTRGACRAPGPRGGVDQQLPETFSVSSRRLGWEHVDGVGTPSRRDRRLLLVEVQRPTRRPRSRSSWRVARRGRRPRRPARIRRPSRRRRTAQEGVRGRRARWGRGGPGGGVGCRHLRRMSRSKRISKSKFRSTSRASGGARRSTEVEGRC